jgi:hypothetical protein
MDITQVVEDMLDTQKDIMIHGIINDPANEPEREPDEEGDFSGASELDDFGGR